MEQSKIIDTLETYQMGMLFTSVKKLLELPNLIKRINIDMLLACPLSQLKIGDHCYHG